MRLHKGMPRVLLTLLLALVMALPALAAEPSAGTVSAESPKVTWAGEIVDALAAYTLALENGSAAEACATPLPVCDTFTLTVDAAAATKLTVTAVGATEDDWPALSVTDPAGNETLVGESQQTQTIVLSNPAKGDYTVRVLGSPALFVGPMAYEGTATLEVPAPPPAATPAPTRAPAPQPTPQPTPEPAPTPPPSAGPPPPVQAGPRSLAMHADRRRLRRAVRYGFRARVVCHGGCAKVKLRAYVSRLTARNLRLGNFAGDVEVGSARILRNAEGRRQTVVTFRPSYRKRLARARRFQLAIEAVATDPDGRVRTTLQRLTLRR